MAATATATLPQTVVGRGTGDGALIQGGAPAPREQFLERDEMRAAKRLPGDEDGGGDGPPRAAVMPERRLVLVLDLDNTLLHTLPVVQLAPRETYLLRRPPPPKGQAQMFVYKDETGQVHLTKLRPFVHTFLREVAAMYDLRICTMGVRPYARHMARLLDPDGALFAPGHIFTREDFKGTDKKALDIVPGCDERATVVLDDMVEVWEDHLDNLLPVRPYEYFAGCVRRGMSYAEMRFDEDAAEGALAKALDLLRRAHDMFAEGGDVREVLRRLRKKPELRVQRRC